MASHTLREVYVKAFALQGEILREAFLACLRSFGESFHRRPTQRTAHHTGRSFTRRRPCSGFGSSLGGGICTEPVCDSGAETSGSRKTTQQTAQSLHIRVFAAVLLRPFGSSGGLFRGSTSLDKLFGDSVVDVPLNHPNARQGTKTSSDGGGSTSSGGSGSTKDKRNSGPSHTRRGLNR